MKKTLKLLFLICTLLGAIHASAEQAELTVELAIFDNGAIVIPSEAQFDLYSPDGSIAASSVCEINRDTTAATLTFNIADYQNGAVYSLSPVSGITELDYIGIKYATGDKLPLNTADAMNFRVAATPLYVPPTGVRTDKVSFTFHVQQKGIVAPTTAKFYLCDRNGTLMQSKTVNIGANAKKVSLSFTVPQYYTGETFFLVPVSGMVDASYYETVYKPYAPIKIGTYASLSGSGETIVGNSFDLGLTVQYKTPQYAPDSDYAKSVEAFINSSGMDSKTNYLIWISKKDYRVNVFYGNTGAWDFVNCFDCSIGAPSTPTITGAFEYFQYQPKWTYDTYYVGPVMRFAPKGYAMHSTLLRYDGSDADGRLRMKISHGCVRLAPSSINWLVEYIPLHTRVYITE